MPLLNRMIISMTLRLLLPDATHWEVQTALIGLAPKLTRCSGLSYFGIKFGIGLGGDVACDAKQGAKGVEGIEATVAQAYYR